MDDLEKFSKHINENLPSKSLAVVCLNRSFWRQEVVVTFNSASRIQIYPALYQWRLQYFKNDDQIAVFEVKKHAGSNADFEFASSIINHLIASNG